MRYDEKIYIPMIPNSDMYYIYLNDLQYNNMVVFRNDGTSNIASYYEISNYKLYTDVFRELKGE